MSHLYNDIQTITSCLNDRVDAKLSMKSNRNMTQHILCIDGHQMTTYVPLIDLYEMLKIFIKAKYPEFEMITPDNY